MRRRTFHTNLSPARREPTASLPEPGQVRADGSHTQTSPLMVTADSRLVVPALETADPVIARTIPLHHAPRKGFSIGLRPVQPQKPLRAPLTRLVCRTASRSGLSWRATNRHWVQELQQFRLGLPQRSLQIVGQLRSRPDHQPMPLGLHGHAGPAESAEQISCAHRVTAASSAAPVAPAPLPGAAGATAARLGLRTPSRVVRVRSITGRAATSGPCPRRW